MQTTRACAERTRRLLNASAEQDPRTTFSPNGRYDRNAMSRFALPAISGSRVANAEQPEDRAHDLVQVAIMREVFRILNI